MTNRSAPPRRSRELARAAARAIGRSARSIPLHDEDRRDQPRRARVSGMSSATSAPDDRAHDRRRRHPRDDMPVDAALAHVAAARLRRPPPPRSRCSSPAAVCRAPGRDDDERETQRPEDEPEHRAEVPGDEASAPKARRELARPPERLLAAGRRVRGAREDEQEVGEPVQVDERERVDACACDASSASRSARRQTVRATWRRAAASVPPGSTKLLSSGRLGVEAVAVAPRARPPAPA